MLTFSPYNTSPNSSRPGSTSRSSLFRPWSWLPALRRYKLSIQSFPSLPSRPDSSLPPLDPNPISWRASPRRPSLSLPTYPNPDLPHFTSLPDAGEFLSPPQTSTTPRPFLPSPRRSLLTPCHHHHHYHRHRTPSRSPVPRRISFPPYTAHTRPVQPLTPPSTPLPRDGLIE